MEHFELYHAQCAVYAACWASYGSPDTFEEAVKRAEDALRRIVIQDIPVVRETTMVRLERISKILSSLYAIQIAYPTEDMTLPEAPCVEA